MRSDKPQAKPFQDWVTQVVLPAIRKDGGYIKGEEKVAQGELSEDEFVLRAMQILSSKVDRLKQERNEALAGQAQEHLRAEGLKQVVGAREHDLNRFARTLPGVNRNALKRSLLNLGYLYRGRGGTYRVYSKYRPYFRESIQPHTGNVDIFVSSEGKELLTELHRKHLLQMLCSH